MRVFLRVTILVQALASACSAQIVPFVPCKAGKVTIVGHADRVTLQRVAFLESYGEISASVFIPDSAGPVPGIVFSHSSIHGPNNSTDLLRFALALARADAASIILDGTIEWQTPNDESKRPAHVMACAGQWLLQHASLDRHRLAVAGTTADWGGGDTPFCLAGERPCWSPGAWLNFGQASPAEWGNTNAMLTIEGQLHMARFAQQHLQLAEVKPEWLVSGRQMEQVP